MGPLIALAARAASGMAARGAAKMGMGKLGQSVVSNAVGSRVAGLSQGQQDGAPKQFRGADLTEFRGY